MALAVQYGRYGYRRIFEMLKAADWDVGVDRVQRSWRREGLKFPGNKGREGGYGLTMGLASGSDRRDAITFGPTTLSRPRPTMGARSA